MPGRRKKFIDKRNAVTFHLVHRSQRDPLQADDEASARVLLEAAGGQKESDVRKEEQRKFGVFYDDDYDYLQHLKDINEINDLQPGDYLRLPQERDTSEQFEDVSEDDEPKLQLPSSVFASELETEVGLLNKAVAVKGPRPDWDPDIVAALDEDFDFSDPENLLEDDFMVQANADCDGGEWRAVDGRTRPEFDDDRLFLSDDDDNGDDDDVASDEAEFSGDEDRVAPLGSHGDDPFTDVETQSRFTEYSMSSSVMHRNEGLTLLDDRFEKLYEQYDDTEIGALDHEELEGGIDQGNHLLNTILHQFEEQQKHVALKDVVEPGEAISEGEEDSGVDDNDLVKVVMEEPDKKWDCESILSTYSNLYNHPRLIEEPKKQSKIKLSTKSGLPLGVLEQPGLTLKQIEKERRQEAAADRAATYRPKDETLDEKKSRKQTVKAERKERRAEKKANKVAFKVEQKKQETELQNVRKNLQGVKIT